MDGCNMASLLMGTPVTMGQFDWSDIVHHGTIKYEPDIDAYPCECDWIDPDDFFRTVEADSNLWKIHNNIFDEPEMILPITIDDDDDEDEKVTWNCPSPTLDDFVDPNEVQRVSGPLLGYNKATPSYDSFFTLPEALKRCVSFDTIQPNLYQHPEPKEEIKPYHPTQDHDYMKLESEDSDAVEVKEEPDEGEPVVDVWKIENFCEPSVSAPSPVEEQSPTYKRMLRERTKPASKRTAESKRRDQARKISHAVHAVLNIKKPVNRQQYKNKLKNSVETTPSQSDIEEWQSHSVRPMYTKITKKKTSKGRIDHSQSERNRREILRKKFCELRKKIPMDFLRGEKASAQISKQKILNGAKGYIAEIYNSQSSYRTMQQQNKLLHELWQTKHSSKPSKSVKRQK